MMNEELGRGKPALDLAERMTVDVMLLSFPFRCPMTRNDNSVTSIHHSLFFIPNPEFLTTPTYIVTIFGNLINPA